MISHLQKVGSTIKNLEAVIQNFQNNSQSLKICRYAKIHKTYKKTPEMDL